MLILVVLQLSHADYDVTLVLYMPMSNKKHKDFYKKKRFKSIDPLLLRPAWPLQELLQGFNIDQDTL